MCIISSTWCVRLDVFSNVTRGLFVYRTQLFDNCWRRRRCFVFSERIPSRVRSLDTARKLGQVRPAPGVRRSVRRRDDIQVSTDLRATAVASYSDDLRFRMCVCVCVSAPIAVRIFFFVFSYNTSEHGGVSFVTTVVSSRSSRIYRDEIRKTRLARSVRVKNDRNG